MDHQQLQGQVDQVVVVVVVQQERVELQELQIEVVVAVDKVMSIPQQHKILDQVVLVS